MSEQFTTDTEPEVIRQHVAGLFNGYEAALTGGRAVFDGGDQPRPGNPSSRVDWHEAEVLELANKTLRELTDEHNQGRGESLALLCEIADEEGWS